MAHIFDLIYEIRCRLLLCIYCISCIKVLGDFIEILLSLERLDVGTTDLLISFVAKCHLVRGLDVLEDRRIIIGLRWQVGIATSI